MPSLHLPPPHAWRDRLVRELHARPSEPLSEGVCLSRLMMAVGEGGGEEARAHVGALCAKLGAPEPAPGAAFHAVDLGTCQLRWEKHTEIVTYTIAHPLDMASAPFSANAASALPPDWLAAVPGALLLGVHAEIRAHGPELEGAARLAFGHDGFAAALAGDGQVWIASDFRTHADGFERLLIGAPKGINPSLTGRVVQAALELSAYRMAALLGFPTAQETRQKLATLEDELVETMGRFETGGDPSADRALLDQLTSLSARAEALANATSYRFSASAAYYRLVLERIETLAERPGGARTSLGAFLARRLGPAMRTCDAVLARQEALLERIARATRLLATRVQVNAEEQNARLLDSMNTRGRVQLRLQQTVEGLSVVALSYYVLGILGYVFKGLAEAGAKLDPAIAVAVVALPTIGCVWWFINRVKEQLGEDA